MCVDLLLKVLAVFYVFGCSIYVLMRNEMQQTRIYEVGIVRSGELFYYFVYCSCFIGI